MFELFIFLGLLFLGYVIGQYLEKSHYQSIKQREGELSKIPAIATKVLPEEFESCETKLVAGNVVISVDYFKKFVAGIRILIGGRVTTFESLIDRARREAVLRMKEQTAVLGASYVFNIKMETSSISKGQKDAIGSVEVLAYGTAVIKK